MAATFLVQERLPLPLGTCVDNLYYMQGRVPYGREKVFPAPTFDLKINLGDPVVAFDSGDRSKETVCRDSCRAGEGNADHRCLASSLLGSEIRKSAATPLQSVFTKSYVTPSNPEPEAADVAALPADAPRRAEAPPRPRRHSTRSSGVSSLLFGIFRW